jgi:hypothetical protein
MCEYQGVGYKTQALTVSLFAALPYTLGRETQPLLPAEGGTTMSALISPPALPRRTKDMTVNDTSFLVDRLGKDCSPLQYLRELTENALKAISLLPVPNGEVIWDVYWPWYEQYGVFKLSIVDTGIGMTGPEMVEYINQLAAGIAERALDKNFGVGAKISALPLNPAGLLYISWKDGVGHMIHLWRDPATSRYGLKLLERPDGTFDYWAEVTDDLKPDSIREHGTLVVLLGEDDDQDTMKAPAGALVPSRWILRYLNSRYLDFPNGVTVKARDGWDQPRSSRYNTLRTVTGMQAWLRSNKEDSGIVPLTGAQAHWWIVNEGSDAKGHHTPLGQVAALYKNELYEVVYGRAGITRLQSFGIIFGHGQVALYVEPTSSDTLTSNTARSQLLLNGEALPWDDWAAEFRVNMPAELLALIERIGSASESSDHGRSIWDRLKAIKDIFHLSRYRATRKGTVEVGIDLDRPSDDGGVSIDPHPDPILEPDPDSEPDPDPTPEPEPELRRLRNTSKADKLFSMFLKVGGDPGMEGKGDEGPKAKWVSVTDGTRTLMDMEDRAAKYLAEEDLILINADFRVFNDMISRWMEFYLGVPSAGDTIREVVREWFEQQLVEAIVGAKALKGSPEWAGDSLTELWSEQALTAVVMPRYHVDASIKRTLGSRLGSLRSVA